MDFWHRRCRLVRLSGFASSGCGAGFLRSIRCGGRCEPDDRGWRRRRWDRRVEHDAPISERPLSQITITDPSHALFGRSFPLVSVRAERGQGYLVFGLPDGRRRTVRKSSTNFDVPAGDDGPAADFCLPRVSVRTLVPLARHLRLRFATAAMAEVIRDARSSTSDPTACVASSRKALDLDGGPSSLASSADFDPDPSGQAMGPDGAPPEGASFPADEGGER